MAPGRCGRCLPYNAHCRGAFLFWRIIPALRRSEPPTASPQPRICHCRGLYVLVWRCCFPLTPAKSAASGPPLTKLLFNFVFVMLWVVLADPAETCVIWFGFGGRLLLTKQRQVAYVPRTSGS